MWNVLLSKQARDQGKELIEYTYMIMYVIVSLCSNRKTQCSPSAIFVHCIRGVATVKRVRTALTNIDDIFQRSQRFSYTESFFRKHRKQDKINHAYIHIGSSHGGYVTIEDPILAFALGCGFVHASRLRP